MSQKTGRRSRKPSNSPVVMESNKETEEKPEITNTKNDITKKDSNNKSPKGTKVNVQEIQLETKDENEKIENPVVSTENLIEKDSQSVEVNEKSQTNETVETENSEGLENSKSEEQVSQEELLEPLILEENTNGVEILIESTEEIIKNEGKNQEETKTEEEKIVNGESHSDLDETNLQNEENNEQTEKLEEFDGKKNYNFEEINLECSSNEIYSQTLEDISTRAVAGSDTTRFEENFGTSKFLSTTKDKSLTESLRHLTARRPIRNRNYFPPDANIYNLREDARKRKYFDDESQDAKRAKKDSPGIMSYFGYPFKKPDASSTPKLTGYRASTFDNDLSNIKLNNSNEKTANKWCSVM